MQIISHLFLNDALQITIHHYLLFVEYETENNNRNNEFKS